MNGKKWLVVILIVGVVVLCVCACVVLAGVGFFALDEGTVDSVIEDWSFDENVDPLIDDFFEDFQEYDEYDSFEEEAWEELPLAVSEGEVAEASYAAILAEDVPANDAGEVLVRYGFLDEVPMAPTAPLVNYVEGDVREFVVADDEGEFVISARLAQSGTHVMVWVEEGVFFDEDDLDALVREFDTKIYGLNQGLFGSEWSPGIDGDARIVILYAEDVGADTAGYFSAEDEKPASISESSNEAEMFVLNANVVELNEEYTFGTLAHEYQHMIHWFYDQNETLWLDEGLAELGAFVGGYELDGLDYEFLQTPDFPLTRWDEDQEYEHYGASFSFVNYLYNRLGEGMIRQIVQAEENGLASIDAVLVANGAYDWVRGEALRAEDLVLDWMVTNWLLDETVADGRFAYANYVNAPQVAEGRVLAPLAGEAFDFSVHPFGADYVTVDASDGFAMHFDGQDMMPFLDVAIEEGTMAFWSQSVDNSNSALTRAFDLRNVSGEVWMDFEVWYDVEDDYDYVYLMVSENGGRDWEVLETVYGEYSEYEEQVGWTGFSRRWLSEEVDLSAYAGEEILVRFDYLTDGVESLPGFLVDDVRIDAIGYATGFEEADASWMTEGFVRVGTVLPQEFSVAAVIENGNETQVEYVELDAGNEFDFSMAAGEAEKVTFVISGATRGVTEKASYSIWFE